ncbi:hypothetical protein AB6A40_010234 [Gnathostoma spinigerum]|uniref:Small integral membrane protein 15 n=1 Tax=Gnathostoma spinigerum TaxID=75299 RepID=A0ABD6EU77_9BILA
MVSHLWNVFEEIGHQHYSTWLKDNLALVIILTTSIVFVIPCIIVSRMDMHRKERLRKRKKLRFSYNQVNSI